MLVNMSRILNDFSAHRRAEIISQVRFPVNAWCGITDGQVLSFSFFSWGGVRLSPLGTLATSWPIVQAPADDDECGAVGGMRIGRENRSIWRKPAPVPLYPPQIPHDLT
jgi:hypothetical protein